MRCASIRIVARGYCQILLILSETRTVYNHQHVKYLSAKSKPNEMTDHGYSIGAVFQAGEQDE